MDLILIILFLVIVICMGYILLKPLFYHKDNQEPTNTTAYLEIKYQMLLLEIKRVKTECEAGNIPREECEAQLSKLKKEAVNLVSQLDLELTELQNIFPQQDIFSEPEDSLEKFCPQCGEQVEPSDKFCMHCGHSL